MKHIPILFLLACGAGCATNSGVFSVAPDTYRVATRATWELGGVAGATRMALSEATNFCAKKSQSLRVLSNSNSYGHFEGGQVDMTFTCEATAKTG
jgi:hypothetical protein